MSVSEIESEIAELREELSDVQGTECEVYTRIVGYYRNVKNWNPGKKDEYKNRKVFEDHDTEREFKKVEVKKIDEARPINPNCPWG